MDVRTHYIMDVIMAGSFSERIKPCRYHGRAMDALFSPLQHCFQAPAPVSELQFLIRASSF